MNEARRRWKIIRTIDAGHCGHCGSDVMQAHAQRILKPEEKGMECIADLATFTIECSGEEQHICSGMKEAERRRKATPFRVKKSEGFWVESEEVTQQPQQENEEMRTLYNASHTDRDGRNWPIFGMTDGHMIRLLNHKAKRFNDIREKMCGAPTHSDPAIAALGKATRWKPEELLKNTMEAVDELSPFLQEALVRGGHVAQAAIEAMRLITKRTTRVELPDENKSIESATEELDWDRPDDTTKLIEGLD